MGTVSRYTSATPPATLVRMPLTASSQRSTFMHGLLLGHPHAPVGCLIQHDTPGTDHAPRQCADQSSRFGVLKSLVDTRRERHLPAGSEGESGSDGGGAGAVG